MSSNLLGGFTVKHFLIAVWEEDFSTFQNESEIIPDAVFYKLLGLEEAHFSFKDISKSFADPGDCVTWKKILASEDP